MIAGLMSIGLVEIARKRRLSGVGIARALNKAQDSVEADVRLRFVADKAKKPRVASCQVHGRRRGAELQPQRRIDLVPTAIR